jgi:hypothetical protein
MMVERASPHLVMKSGRCYGSEWELVGARCTGYYSAIMNILELVIARCGYGTCLITVSAFWPQTEG